MTAFTEQDYCFMQQAISLAKQGHFTTSPNPRVGCVLVKNQQVIGEGFHQKAGDGHAEVNALAACQKNGFSAVGATAYVTLEPCSHFGRTPPCAKGLIDAQVAHVVVAMVDPNPQVSGRGLKMLAQAGIRTSVGLLEEAAQQLNVGFNKLMLTGMPYVRCKLAASLDGKTAMANGESKWITSAAARQDVQRLRAQSCAIISGADAVIIDNAKMTVRWSELGSLQKKYNQADLRQPIRVIIDNNNKLSPDLALFKTMGRIMIIRNTIENHHQWPHFVEQVVIPVVGQDVNSKKAQKGSNKTDLSALLLYLAQQGLNDILVESGARLAGAFIEQYLVDELVLYQAPKLMGADAKGLAIMPSLEHLTDARQLSIKDLRMVGKDIRITASLATKTSLKLHSINNAIEN